MPRLIHTADLQIGKQFENLGAPVDKLAYLRQARIEVIGRIGKLAKERQAEAILVAGDVFERSQISDLVIRQSLTAMEETGCTWYLLPGNHDPDGPAGVWDRVERIGHSDRIRVLRDQQTVFHSEALAILPAPLARRHQFADPTEGFGAQSTAPAVLRVGLAHGSVRNRLAPAAETHNMISDTRADDAHLDYLALGDWHSSKQIAPRTWYAGTPEPDDFGQESGYVLLVDLAGPGQEPVVERLHVAQYHWHKAELDLRSPGAPTQMKTVVAEACAPLSSAVIHLALKGTVSLAERSDIDQELARIEAAAQVLRASTECLIEEPTESDLDDLGRQGFMANVVARLRQLESAVNNGDSDYARKAMRKLYLEHMIGEK